MSCGRDEPVEMRTSAGAAFRGVRMGIRKDQFVRQDGATRNGDIVSDREPQMNLSNCKTEERES